VLLIAECSEMRLETGRHRQIDRPMQAFSADCSCPALDSAHQRPCRIAVSVKPANYVLYFGTLAVPARHFGIHLLLVVCAQRAR
jgi:hypothetical protein